MTENDRELRDSFDLRERFAALRREEEAGAPRFGVRPVGRREAGRWRMALVLVAAAACLVVIVAGGLWLRRPLPEAGKPIASGSAASITAWKPATDFLLETPGRAMLTTVPAIGSVQGGLGSAAHLNNLPKKHVSRQAG